MLLYIHFPFCASKCAYCDFTSYAGCDEALVFSYLTALKREISFAGERFPNARIDTVYLGGGTPSLLSPRRIENLFAHIAKSFRGYSPCEVSVEVNPDSATEDRLAAFAAAGVNRLSMGVQSFPTTTCAAREGYTQLTARVKRWRVRKIFRQHFA